MLTFLPGLLRPPREGEGTGHLLERVLEAQARVSTTGLHAREVGGERGRERSRERGGERVEREERGERGGKGAGEREKQKRQGDLSSDGAKVL